MNTCFPLQHHDEIARNKVPALRWDGQTSAEIFRETCRAKLWELLGMDQMEPCEPVMTVTQEDEIGGSRHIRFTLQTEVGYYTHCDLLLPQKPKGKLPSAYACRDIPRALTFLSV